MPSFPDLSQPLRGPAAELRPVAERDIPEILIAHQDDPEMCGRLGLGRPPSGAELGRRIEAEPAARSAGTGVGLTILAAGSDDCRGELEVHDVDWDHRRAELGIWLAPQSRGQGLAAGALRLSGGWLIESCGLERVGILADPDNTPLVGAARRAGFTEEGRLRGYRRRRGHRADVVVLSLIAEDVRP